MFLVNFKFSNIYLDVKLMPQISGHCRSWWKRYQATQQSQWIKWHMEKRTLIYIIPMIQKMLFNLQITAFQEI